MDKKYDAWYDLEFNYEEVPLTSHGKKLYFQKVTCNKSNLEKNILFVHGLTVNHKIMDIAYKGYNIVRNYVNSGYNGWLIDLSGHGQSESWENPLEINTQIGAEDIIAAVEIIKDITGAEKVDLWGWSWGAMTTSMAAGMRPDLVRRLVMCAPVTGGTFPSMPKEWFADEYINVAYPTVARLFPMKGIKSGQEPGEDFEYDTARVEPELINQVVHDFSRYVFDKGRPNGPSADVCCETDEWKIKYQDLRCPTFIAWGDDDIYPSTERIHTMLEILPKGSVGKFIPGASHSIPFEKTISTVLHYSIIEWLNSDL